MDYHIALDSYTVRDEEYKDSYAKLQNDKKVIENIKQFIEMINTKSYEQAYNLLDEQFKNTNFPTIEAFKQYISQIMFENTKAESVTITQEGYIFICDVVLVDKTSQIAEIKNVKIIQEITKQYLNK